MKLYLDDTRSNPSGYVLVKSYEEFIEVFEQNIGHIDTISLDHDLGTDKTGYSVCLWLVENDYFNGIEEIIIHSSNTVGVNNMIQLLDRYAPSNIKLYRLNANREIYQVYRNRI